ncbi:MAG: phosphoribosylformylglycinamidine synthase II [Pseudohongiellaceae bacterium]|jgi:phosphoribosylformylglycinamidine synthase II
MARMPHFPLIRDPSVASTRTDGEHTAVCIEISIRPGRRDVLASRLAAAADEAGLALPDGLQTLRGLSLRIAGGLPSAEILAERLLADPLMNVWRVFLPEQPPSAAQTRRLEVVRRPGVMDPTASSVTRAAAALGLSVRDVRSWSGYLFPSETDLDSLKLIGKELLANDIVEELILEPSVGVPPASELGEVTSTLSHVPMLNVDDDELRRLSVDGCLALDDTEMKTVQEHFRSLEREPTDIELETLAQTWSEHCKHKTLTGLVDYEGVPHDNLLKSTIARATHELDREFCRSVFVDNAGVVDFDENHYLTFKVETHNHPSALEPYGGAGTGMGGVLRDTMGTGLGARPVASTDVFCFGPHNLPDDELPQGCMHPRRIMKGVVSGVRDYGNRMGIPTVNGAVCFDTRYVANPIVYCGSVGILPIERLPKKVSPGDLIVVAGGATGRDGIHGATFSSLELHSESETMSSGAVQIGNAIEEKRLLEAQMQARDRGLYSSVTDCGAGGLSSAVGEMGEEVGAHVVLDAVPLKYHGLSYTEIWISEAQERMVFSVPPEHGDELLALFAAEDVPATVIGTFDGSARLTAEYGGTEVMNLSMAFVHDGLPRQTRKATRRVRELADPVMPPVTQSGELLRTLLAMPNIASKEWIIRQYDHEVQAGSVIKPLVGPQRDGPSDAAVCAPVLGSRKAFALGCGINPWLGDVDPYRMTLHAIDEAMRNVVAVGGDPTRASILDNFSWGNCEKPDNLGDLVEACLACYDGAMAFSTPFISGKDSLNNDYRVGGESLSIPPTLLITALALVDDVLGTATMDLKTPGNTLVVVGLSGRELGGSHLARHLGTLGAEVPPVDLTLAPQVMTTIHGAVAAGELAACHDLSEGGLAVAAAEMAFAGCLGAELDLAPLPLRGEVDSMRKLFGEDATRFLLEIQPAHLDAVLARLSQIPHAVIGHTVEAQTLTIRDGATELLCEPLDGLRQAFTSTHDLDREHNAP